MNQENNTPEDNINTRHLRRMQRKKELMDQKIDAAQRKTGVVVINAGNGKGKSSSGFGMVMRAMGRAGMVVVPSRWEEPFGLTALEAMAAGAPLLCTARGGLPEVFGEVGVAIDPDDSAGMADAMVALAGDPARRAALGAAGVERAKRFDLAGAAARIAGLRRGMIADWPGGSGRTI